MINTDLASSLKSTYQLGNPYPHIIFDNFLPQDIAKQTFIELSNHNNWAWDDMSGYSESEKLAQVNKWWTPWDSESKTILSNLPVTWKCLEYFNSKQFLLFLEELTGIENLIPDVDFEGGGVHKITNEGRLELHSDYNKHPNPEKDMWRRINLLLYLTPDWKYNGDLELWNKDPLTHIKTISPQFNRAVIFNTTDEAIHGHPTPLVCPTDVSRYSFALYYFTKDRPEEEKSDSTAAIWYDSTYL